MSLNFQDIIRAVYDEGTNVLRTSATLSGASGQVTVSPVQAWPDPKTYIGLVTVTGNLSASLGGNITLNTSPNFIGLVTVVQSSAARSIVGNVTLTDSRGYIGLVTVTQASSARTITGNVTLSDSKTYIGLTTTTIANNPVLGAGVNGIGFATVHQGSTWTVTQASSARTITGNLTLSDSKAFIGLVTVGNTVNANIQLSNTAVKDDALFGDGITTGVLSSHARLYNGSSYDRWRGDTGGAYTKNAGTSKTLIHLPIALSSTSAATIFVATGGSAIFKVTSLLVSANATTQVRLKSGVTYLTGNASIGVTLNPAGGWVETGSVDSPVYIGLASGSALVLEKTDITTLVGGKVIYYQE